MPVIWAPFVPLIPQVLLPVDRRPRLDLAVEHDRELMGDLLAAAERVREQLAPLRDVTRDLAEPVGAGVRELHRHDRLAGRRVEVLGAPESLVSAGQLGAAVPASIASLLRSYLIR